MTAAMASLSALMNPASVEALFDMPVTLPSTSLTSFVGISLYVTTNTLSSIAVICSSALAVFIRAHFLIRDQKKNNIPKITSIPIKVSIIPTSLLALAIQPFLT